MKIGIDASRYGSEQATGVEWYSHHIINSLMEYSVKHGEDSIVLYSPEPLKFDEKTQEFIKIHRSKFQNTILPGKRIWTHLHLGREVAKNTPDILFVPSHVLPLDAPKNSVITIHDIAFKYLKTSYSFIQNWYLNWSTKFAVKKAAKIIVPSNATKEDLVHFYKCAPEKIVVIPHGFKPPKPLPKAKEDPFSDHEIFRYFKIDKDTKYILFVGRLESKKNLERLVKAFSRFVDSHPEYKLILAGKRGVGFDNIMRVIQEKNMMEKVIMPGYVNEEEKNILIQNCKLFAFPSLYEGFGLPILEAFYFEKPVLLSKVSSLPEVAGEAAFYCDPYDVESIEMGLMKIVSDEAYAKSLVESGKERLKEFSWSKAAKKVFAVFENIISEDHGK
ncbi:MAG: glycosyltransferase family 1 protein [Candidatus Gracilibacteria bacterium]|nr:glycosyltransferase family 1 protein [Candidatus Gracilibacteria bacterium]